MAYKRKSGISKRKTSTRRRRTMNISRPIRNNRLAGATLRVKRMVYAGVLAPSATLTTGTSYFWQYNTVSLTRSIANFNGVSSSLGGLTNLAEYTPLFDQYKLGAYKVTFRPRIMNISSDQTTPSANIANPATYPPQFVTLIDGKNTLNPGGTYSPATLNTLLEAGGKIRRGDKPFSIYVKPWIPEQYGTGATRYVRPKFTDLDTAGQAMSHRGFHLFLMRQGFYSDANDTACTWDVYVTYYLTFKNQK